MKKERLLMEITNQSKDKKEIIININGLYYEVKSVIGNVILTGKQILNW